MGIWPPSPCRAIFLPPSYGALGLRAQLAEVILDIYETMWGTVFLSVGDTEGGLLRAGTARARACVCACVLQKGASPTCFSTPTDPFGLTRFVSDQCCVRHVCSSRFNLVCVCVCVCVRVCVRASPRSQMLYGILPYVRKVPHTLSTRTLRSHLWGPRPLLLPCSDSPHTLAPPPPSHTHTHTRHGRAGREAT